MREDNVWSYKYFFRTFFANLVFKGYKTQVGRTTFLFNFYLTTPFSWHGFGFVLFLKNFLSYILPFSIESKLTILCYLTIFEKFSEHQVYVHTHTHVMQSSYLCTLTYELGGYLL